MANERPTTYEKIASFLKSTAPCPYCDDCIVAEISADSLGEVRRETDRMIRELSFLGLRDTICTRCGQPKSTIIALYEAR